METLNGCFMSCRKKGRGPFIHFVSIHACFVVNLMTVDNLAALFNCTPVGQASDLMMVPA